MSEPATTPETVDPTGQVALITGAARRLGRAIAIGLARSGRSIAIHHNSSPADASEVASEIEKLGVQAEVFQADLTEVANARRLVEDVGDRFGRLDVLVNNAAIFQRRKLLEITVEDWDRTLDLNLRAPFFCSQAAAPLMRRSRSGAIVNLADVGAFQAWPGYAHHCISKAGLVMLTRVLARALAPHIRVNAIAPGPVLPPDDLSAGQRRELAQMTALKRIGTPDDVVRAVVFLIDAEYVTGETLVVDGGKLLQS